MALFQLHGFGLNITNFAIAIATPSSQVTNTYDSPFVGTLICSRQATWSGDYTTFNGTVIAMTGAIQFYGETNVDYEITWKETDVNGINILRTNIVSGTNGMMTTVIFNPGPPSTLGTNLASDFKVNEVGAPACTRSCGPATLGGPGPFLTSARLEMSLGKAGYRRSAGLLRFHELRPRSDMATPSRLAFIGTTNFVTLVTDGSGNRRQALAPQCLADGVTSNSNRYDVRFYGSTNVGSLTGSV